MSTEKTEESKEIQQTSAEEPQREGDADGGKTQKRKAKEKKKGNRNSRSVLKSLMLTAVLPVLGSGLIRFLGVNIFVTPNKFAPAG